MYSEAVAAPTTQVLVVYVNAAVGVALAGQLMDVALVALATTEEALDTLARPSSYDVVLCCPYLHAAERAGIITACGALLPLPVVLAIRDTTTWPGAHVACVSRGVAASSVAPLLQALRLPLG